MLAESHTCAWALGNVRRSWVLRYLICQPRLLLAVKAFATGRGRNQPTVATSPAFVDLALAFSCSVSFFEEPIMKINHRRASTTTAATS